MPRHLSPFLHQPGPVTGTTPSSPTTSRTGRNADTYGGRTSHGAQEEMPHVPIQEPRHSQMPPEAPLQVWQVWPVRPWTEDVQDQTCTSGGGSPRTVPHRKTSRHPPSPTPLTA